MRKGFLILSFLTSTISLHAVVLPEGTDARIKDITTNDDGIVTSVFLSEPTEINTPLGKIESIGEVFFNTEGKVIEFTPNRNGAAESPIGVLNYEGRDTIKCYDSGCVKSMTLSEDTDLSINNVNFTCNPSNISFYENWKPSRLNVSKKLHIKLSCGEIVCAYNSYVMFYPDGNISFLELGEPANLSTTDGTFTAIGLLMLSSDGKPMAATVLKSDGLNSKYGKIFPMKDSFISFHENGKIETIIPQDITIIQYENSTFMAVSEKMLKFDEEGIINEATVKGKKLKIYDWTFEFVEDDFNFVIYPNKKIYIPAVIFNTINGKGYEYTPNSGKIKRLIIDPENCYYWNRELDHEKESTGKHSWEYKVVYVDNIYKLNKESLFENLVVKIKDGIPSHFTKEGEFDYFHCPLIFDKDQKIIGYRKSVTVLEEWDPISDRNVDYSNYNRTTNEYENYIEDVFFDEADK